MHTEHLTLKYPATHRGLPVLALHLRSYGAGDATRYRACCEVNLPAGAAINYLGVLDGGTEYKTIGEAMLGAVQSAARYLCDQLGEAVAKNPAAPWVRWLVAVRKQADASEGIAQLTANMGSLAQVALDAAKAYQFDPTNAALVALVSPASDSPPAGESTPPDAAGGGTTSETLSCPNLAKGQCVTIEMRGSDAWVYDLTVRLTGGVAGGTNFGPYPSRSVALAHAVRFLSRLHANLSAPNAPKPTAKVVLSRLGAWIVDLLADREVATLHAELMEQDKAAPAAPTAVQQPPTEGTENTEQQQPAGRDAGGTASAPPAPEAPAGKVEDTPAPKAKRSPSTKTKEEIATQHASILRRLRAMQIEAETKKPKPELLKLLINDLRGQMPSYVRIGFDAYIKVALEEARVRDLEAEAKRATKNAEEATEHELDEFRAALKAALDGEQIDFLVQEKRASDAEDDDNQDEGEAA